MSEPTPQQPIVIPTQAQQSARTDSDVVERLDFETVLKEERDYIERRRANIGQTDKLTSEDTFGLAFSGGGIRSAAFNLGVLQAFAEKKLLGNLDYLSTVSGGGYIGSWLMAWLHRDGKIDRVEDLLAPDRRANAVAGRQFRKEDADKSDDYVFDDEPTPLYHLRAYSSYLTPRPGVLSVQSWTLFAIYLRNVFLNLLVIVPLSVAVILGIVLAFKMYMVNEYSVILGYSMLVVSILCFAFGAQWIALSIEDVRNNQPKSDPPSNATEQRPFFATTYIPAVVVIVSGCFLLGAACHRQDNRWIGQFVDYIGTFWTFVCCLLVGLLHTCVNYESWMCLIRRQWDKKPIRWLVSGFSAGFLLALFCLWSLWSMESIGDVQVIGIAIEKESIRLILVVPLLLLSMGVAETMQIGILGNIEEATVREKWSFCNAYFALAGTAWLGLLVVVLILPEIFFLPNSIITIAEYAAPAGWAITSIAAAFLAHSPSTSGTKSRWLDWLVQLGPPIFLIGMMVGLSTIVYRWILQPFGIVEPTPGLNWNSVSCVFVAFSLLVALLITTIGCRHVDVNVFSLQELYQYRLVRTFLGASRPRGQRCGAPFISSGNQRSPDPITDLDAGDDIALRELGSADGSRDMLPILLINTALNRVGDVSLNNQERMAESFTLGSLHCGCPTTKFIRTFDGYGDTIKLGTAFAISGAAVAPNMGYYSSPVVTGLLTLFNLRLGAWLGNPLPVKGNNGRFNVLTEMFGNKQKQTTEKKVQTKEHLARDKDPALSAGPMAGWLHLFREMFGLTTIDSKYVYLSDGGHFDNLGVYELLHRRCHYIVACDAGEDPDGSCNELAMIIRKAFIDFGIKIDINIDALRVDPETSLSKRRFAIGKVTFPPRSNRCQPEVGYFIYVKMTLNGTESADIRSYKVKHPDFPHRTTADQFFTESKFESFRKLGHEITSELLKVNASTDTSDKRTNNQSVRMPQVKLQRFLEETVAYGSINLGSEWDTQNQLLGQRYEELQSCLVSSRNLRHMRAEIENRSKLFRLIDQIDSCENSNDSTDLNEEKKVVLAQLKVNTNEERTKQELSAEGGWIVKAINLLSDVFEALELKEYDSVLRKGWVRIARRWMLTSAFKEHWENWKEDYPIVMNEFYESLKADRHWNL